MFPILSPEEVRARLVPFLDSLALRGQKLLLVVPDATRTAPIGLLFQTVFDLVGEVAQLDVMIALGTHPPLSEAQICERLEISAKQRKEKYGRVGFYNHEWDNPAALQTLGSIGKEEIAALSNGLFEMEVPVSFNRRALSYDRILIIGPVFPHEVVGFSGGNKYLFPGIGGPEILNFFHWLGAVTTNARIIGHEATPVRRVVERAASLVPVPVSAVCLVVTPHKLLVGMFVGSPEKAWQDAARVSGEVHIVRKARPFHTVLSCAPKMYDDLWVGGKAMYKLEPVVADGGELIIYAPHIREISSVHGALIEQIGYHTRDYFLANWDKWKEVPWGVLAHSTHVRGVGRMEAGVECPRIRVTLATGISPQMCQKINLGYRDPGTIEPQDYANREDEGVLLVERAGEMLYRLENEPEWAQSN